MTKKVVVSKAMLDRANFMLQVAADYIENNWPDGTVYYDDSECDGYCVAEDCRVAVIYEDYQEKLDD